MKHEICGIADIPTEGTRILPFFGREVHVWHSATGPRAAANVCTHLGGPLECRNGMLVCPWHGASFDLSTGAKRSGPGHPDADLMILPTIADGDTFFYVWGEA